MARKIKSGVLRQNIILKLSTPTHYLLTGRNIMRRQRIQYFDVIFCVFRF